jgi:predicted ATP-dependent endonuclease of OLD family
MLIKKLKINNFKIHAMRECEFNDDINIIAGDNECGKSSLLEAIEICLNFSYRGRALNGELSTDLFNSSCIDTYLAGDLAQDTLPEILIEAYVTGNAKLKGNNNTDNADVEGIFVRIFFDPDLVDSYAVFIANPDNVSTLPVEFYRAEWYSFAWKPLTHFNKGIQCLFVDPTRLHPTFGRSKYINSIINTALDKPSRSALNLNYRQLKSRFDEEEDVVVINNNLDSENDITNKSLKITANIGGSTNWESNLQLAVDNISFNQIGKGEQNLIQVKLVLQNRAKDVDIIMLEEPENHLSHMNLVQLIGYIEKKNKGKQIFLTTHSSYVLNKLSIDKLCLLSIEYSRLSDVEPITVKTLKRLPGYDTLRVILSQKPVLVEGPSDELILKKIYMNKHGHLPEEDGIDIIVVRGIGFKNYLNIVKLLRHPVRVVKDNDGNHQKNIIDWSVDYDEFDFITFYSPTDNLQNSLEPALIGDNSHSAEHLDQLAMVMLSTQTYNIYAEKISWEEKKEYFENWYSGESTGSKKVDSAIRIFESEVDITFPEYLVEAIDFGE